MFYFRIPNLFLTGFFSAWLIFLAGCSGQPQNETAAGDDKSRQNMSVSSGGIYRIPLMNNPATLDPALVQDQYGVSIVKQLFDGLVQFGPYLSVLPALAESWRVEERGKVYRFYLRQEAYFHSGEPVTVDDVVFTIERLLRVKPAPAILPQLLKIDGAQAFRNQDADVVKGLYAIDRGVLEVRLVEPHAPFLTALGMYQAAVVCRDAVNRLGGDFGRQPDGSGPFRLVSWEFDKLIRLERHANYYAGRAFLDEIHYIIYPGGALEQLLADFKNGYLEEMPVYGGIQDELSQIAGLHWIHRPSLSLLFYGIGGKHPFLRNSNFRKALSLAIDRDELIRHVYHSQFEPARSILPPGMPSFNRSGGLIVDDFQQAEAHLQWALEEEKGPLPDIEIVSASRSAFASAELNFVRDRWQRLGIHANIRFIADWKDFEAYLESGSAQVYRYVWFADMPDPDSFFYPLFASASPVNYSGYSNNEVDQMLINARGIIDPVIRSDTYQQIEKIILSSTPVIPLFHLSIDRVYQPNVQGINMSALGAHTMPLHRIWLKPMTALAP